MTTKQERSQRTRVNKAEARRQWLEKLPVMYSHDVLLMWLAHNRGIKGAHKAAREHRIGRGRFYYDGAKLFAGEGTLIAEQRTRKGKPSYIMIVRVPNDIDAIQTLGASIKGNGPMIHVQNGALTVNSAARAMSQFSKYSFRNNFDEKQLARAQKEQDKHARLRIIYYRPVAIKHRTEYERLRNAAYEASCLYNREAYSCRPTNDEALAILGHTHVDGMMYKRLSKVRVSAPSPLFMGSNCVAPAPAPDQFQFQSRAGRYVWPAIGEWAPTVEGVVICNKGYHLCPKDAIDQWSNHGPHLFLAEGDVPGGSQHDKTVYARARLVKYIGNIETITNDMVSALRKTDLPKLKADFVAAEKARDDYRKAYAKYI